MAEFSVEKGDLVYLENQSNRDGVDAVVENVLLLHDVDTGDVIKIMMILSPEEAG